MLNTSSLCVDTPCNLKMLQWLLLLSAVKSTPAVNGYEAIVAFERGTPRFDLIFMDNTMPIMVTILQLRKFVCMHEYY